MHHLLITFLILPLLGFAGSLIYKNEQERPIATISVAVSASHMLLTILFFAMWLWKGSHPISIPVFTLYKFTEFNFGLHIYYDKLTAVYSIIISHLFFIISIFSKYYMHREGGFKRFYNHYLLFYTGINLLALAGNFETLFLGWEIVGITSFLLISFYRDRYLPVKNSMKVLSFYRIGDVALIGAIWFCHHLFQRNILFDEITGETLINKINHFHPLQGILISLLLLLAAAVKSAQFPFSGWLPRAMEGPTVSSAIFYGSISVHIGIFLLMRTYPIWSQVHFAKVVVITMGILSATTATMIGSVQSTAKTQIAYSSIAQIGLIFIEIALGWHLLALIHFAANAFLRTYQLLGSPSIMSYLIHVQFFHFDATQKPILRFIPERLRNTVYILSVKEFDLDFIWFHYFWSPFKKAGNMLGFLKHTSVEISLGILGFGSILWYLLYPGTFGNTVLSNITSVTALLLILTAWTELASAIRSWIYILLSQLFFLLSILQQHLFDGLQIGIYLSGTLGAFAAGIWCLQKVKTANNSTSLNEFHGHVYEHPGYAFLFLICGLTVIGFPISPTFLGFDLLFSDIEKNHRFLLVCSAFTFFFLELAVVRIYARIFLGPHVKNYHEVAKRST